MTFYIIYEVVCLKLLRLLNSKSTTSTLMAYEYKNMTWSTSYFVIAACVWVCVCVYGILRRFWKVIMTNLKTSMLPIGPNPDHIKLNSFICVSCFNGQPSALSVEDLL